jgi:protein-disulfide isomerase
MQRRDVLRASGAALLASLAGCTGLTGSGGGDGGDATTVPGTDTASADSTSAQSTANPKAIGNHPATTDLDAQPRLGDNEDNVIVVFEDPSCPVCKRFEENAVSKVESELVSQGSASLVYRGYPVVYPWGEPANHALEATFDRDEDAFWTLKDQYFDDQSTFDPDNVLERTEQFLGEETDVDGTAVVEDVRNDAYADAVQTDLDAGEAAGVVGTPAVFLFKDGEYLTKAAGNVSFEIILTAYDT